ncbi:MAG: magnesium transporter [Dehalococcoidia bacterium]|nr:magnesium transporter [Dehalococcoidia bacterium]
MPPEIDIATVDLAGLQALAPRDAADGLLELAPPELASLFTRLGDESLAEVLSFLDPFDTARLMGKLSRGQAADVLEEMEPDDAADVMEQLEPADQEAILHEMDPEAAEDVRALLVYPPDSAGGVMTSAYLRMYPDMTADQALRALRVLAEEAETIYYIYITEPETERLLGVLSLRSLVLARPNQRLGDLVAPETIKVRVDVDQEDAARLFSRHNLLALPVVDAEGRLVGIITADDAAEILQEEADEDIERLGGSQPLEEPYLRAGPLRLYRSRILWLMALFVASAYTGNILKFYEKTLSEMVSLSFFIPLLIGTGGNTGSQIVTTLVRAMGTGEVSPSDALRVVRKELMTAVLLGITMAVATYVGTVFLGTAPELGRVVAVTAMCIVLWAALVAAVLPLVLRKLRLDPAVVSAPLITTLVDGTGLMIYFTAAQWLLHLD